LRCAAPGRDNTPHSVGAPCPRGRGVRRGPAGHTADTRSRNGARAETRTPSAPAVASPSHHPTTDHYFGIQVDAACHLRQALRRSPPRHRRYHFTPSAGLVHLSGAPGLRRAPAGARRGARERPSHASPARARPVPPVPGPQSPHVTRLLLVQYIDVPEYVPDMYLTRT
jgi:hypothetical protein